MQSRRFRISGLLLMLATAFNCPSLAFQQKPDAMPGEASSQNQGHQREQPDLCRSLQTPVAGESLADAARRIRAWKECLANSNTAVHVPACDRLKNPVDGESTTEASRRANEWSECVARVNNLSKWTEEHLFKKVDVYNGRLAFAVVPKLSEAPPRLVERMDIYARSSSPVGYRYILTARCGIWNKTVSGSIEGSSRTNATQALGDPTYSLQVSPPCNIEDASLDEVKEAQGTKGPPPLPPIRPGIDDVEYARRLKALEGTSGNQIDSSLQKKVDDACRKRSVSELANAPTKQIGDDMTACAKAYEELQSAIESKGKAEERTKAQGLDQAVPQGSITIQLTGTSGLPFSGDCFFANHSGSISKSFDSSIPFQATFTGVENVNCSFIKKSTYGALKLEVVKDGKVIGESDTDASYGLVSVSRDLNQ